MTTMTETKLLIDNTRRIENGFSRRRVGIIVDENILDAFYVGSEGQGGYVGAGSDVETDGGYLAFNWVRPEGELVFTKLCLKCGGDGQHWATHISQGECFRCAGSGVEPRVGRKTEQELESMRLGKLRTWERKEAKRLAECAARDERVARFAAAEPVIWALLEKTQQQITDNYNMDTYGGGVYQNVNPFLRSMLERLTNVVKGGELSEKQVEALRKFVTPKPADENSSPVIEGRIEIHGVVVSTKVTPDNGYGEGYKMIVRDERGFKVWGSIPNNLWNEVEFLGSYRKNSWGETAGVMEKLVGMEVKFSATVEKSDRDEAFGFFKRPTKAEVVA